MIKIETMRKASTAAVAERVKQILENQHDAPVPQKVFIDTGGVGGGVYDILVELKLSESDAARVSAVDFSRKAFNHIKYDIRRNEIWGNMRHWFMQDDVTVDIPTHSLLIQSLMAPRKKYNKDNKLCVESKDEMLKRGVSSPDCGDALALTFAEPVFGNELETYGSAIENGPMFAPERARLLSYKGHDGIDRELEVTRVLRDIRLSPSDELIEFMLALLAVGDRFGLWGRRIKS